MRKITFSPDSIAEIAIAHYIDQYEAENGKRCTQSYAINALISYGDTFRIMLRQKQTAQNDPTHKAFDLEEEEKQIINKNC